MVAHLEDGRALDGQGFEHLAAGVARKEKARLAIGHVHHGRPVVEVGMGVAGVGGKHLDPAAVGVVDHGALHGGQRLVPRLGQGRGQLVVGGRVGLDRRGIDLSHRYARTQDGGQAADVVGMGMGGHEVVYVVAVERVAHKRDLRVSLCGVTAVDDVCVAVGQHHDLAIALAYVDEVGGNGRLYQLQEAC